MDDLIDDDDVLVFTEGGTVTHVLPRLASPNSGADALCGRSGWPVGWYGTGTQDEYERARDLPLCVRCQAVLRHQRMGRASALDCD
ncbi:hypothetical protein ACWD2L_06110 [Streptomyces sp. NPDC002754]